VWNADRALARDRHELDVIHILGGHSDQMIFAASARRHGLPTVMKLNNHRADLVKSDRLGRWLRTPQVRRWMARRITAHVAISTEIADELLAIGVPRERIHHIPNGVDTERFHPVGRDARRALRRRLGLPEEPVTVLFSGAVVERKRPHLVIEALAACGPDVQLVVLGPIDDHSPYGRRLRGLVGRHNLADRIHFAGYVADPIPYFQAADLFCLPSTSEGLSSAVLEALSCGLGTVVSPVSGMADAIEQGVSGLIEDDAQLATALKTLIADPSQRADFGAAARARILERFDLDEVAQRHLELFRTVASSQ
jgi:glycosyltransferase involved in cell wall biosynthesis